MEKVLDGIVAMVKQHPAGIPLKKLAVFYSQTYYRNLTLSSLGIDSMASLVDYLDGDLVVEGNRVFHKTHCRLRRAGPGGSAKATQDKKKVLQNIMAMMAEHPDGIPLKTVAIAYRQKYHHNLVLASLGFQTISCLVESLRGDLVVRGDVVFHWLHQPLSLHVAQKPAEDNRSATPQRTKTVIGKRSATPSAAVPQVNVSSYYVPPTQAGWNSLGPPLTPAAPLFSTHFTASKPAEKINQHQGVFKVMKKYQPSAPSMEPPSSYLQQVNEELPITQHMSQYDSLEASTPKKLFTQSEPTTQTKTVALQTTAVAQDLTREFKEEISQQAVAYSYHSDADFSWLRADVSSTKEKKKKINNATHREDIDAYFAQIEEVLEANMWELEVLEEDFNNSLIEDVIQDISAELSLFSDVSDHILSVIKDKVQGALKRFLREENIRELPSELSSVSGP